MRISLGCFVLGLGFLAGLASVPAVGQSDVPRVAGGVFGSVGGGPFPLTVDLSSGGYVEAARFWIRPGVEVRGTTQTISSGQQGLILAGPRIAHLIQGGNVYAAALFGPSQQPNGTGTKEISGVTSQVDVGVERDLGPYVRWRVIELNAGFFSGASGLQTFAVSTGLVLHFH
jgi:hypothetical protein